jgi:hypothetical protein
MAIRYLDPETALTAGAKTGNFQPPKPGKIFITGK